MSAIEQYGLWIGIGVAIISLLTGVATYFRGKESQNAKIEEYRRQLEASRHESERQLREEIDKIRADMITVNTRFNVFWSVVEKEIPKILLRPHNPELDRLLLKMEEGKSLTTGEENDMIQRIDDILNEDRDKGLVDSGYKLTCLMLKGRLISKRVEPRRDNKNRNDNI